MLYIGDSGSAALGLDLDAGGAIGSLIYRGRELVDRRDFGRYVTRGAPDWESDRPDDLEGWTALRDVNLLAASAGSLSLNAGGAHPAIVSPAFSIPAGAIEAIEIRMQTTAPTPGMVYYRTDASPEFEATASISFRVAPGWQTYLLPVSAASHWRGFVTGLRLDVASEDAVADIDSIQFVLSDSASHAGRTIRTGRQVQR